MLKAYVVCDEIVSVLRCAGFSCLYIEELMMEKNLQFLREVIASVVLKAAPCPRGDTSTSDVVKRLLVISFLYFTENNEAVPLLGRESPSFQLLKIRR